MTSSQPPRGRTRRAAASNSKSPERQGRSAAAAARPATQRVKEKPGSVTKGVQKGRGSRFLSEVIAELRKVTWPNRKQLAQGTAVVLIVVAVVAVYLAILDAIFGRFVDAVF